MADDSSNKSGKTAYVILTIVTILILVLYLLWFYKSYDNNTGFFTPYEPSDNGNLIVLPNFEGNELYYDNDSPVIEKRDYMLDMGLAMLPPSQFSNDEDFEDTDVRWGLILVVIFAFIFLIIGFVYFSLQKTDQVETMSTTSVLTSSNSAISSIPTM